MLTELCPPKRSSAPRKRNLYMGSKCSLAGGANPRRLLTGVCMVAAANQRSPEDREPDIAKDGYTTLDLSDAMGRVADATLKICLDHRLAIRVPE